MPSGYSANTPQELFPGPGVIRIGNDQLGVTRGAPAFEPGEEFRNPAFDGKTAPIAGLTRKTFTNARITATLLEMNATRLALLFPGSTSVVVGSRTTITPPDAGVFLPAVDNVRVAWRRSDAWFQEVRFPKADVRLTRVAGGAADDEAVWEFEATALTVPGGSTTEDAPYVLITENILPAIP